VLLLPLLQFFSTPPLPCDLSELPVVYKVEEGVDPRK
jgi:cyclin-dependent kinase 12/13